MSTGLGDKLKLPARLASLLCAFALCAEGHSVPGIRQPSHQEQSATSTVLTQEDVRKKVATAVHGTLQQGSGATADGIKYSTYLPPSAESLAVIQRLGDKAVPVLAEFLWSEDGRESWAAMRFLGALGGARIVKPLSDVARRHPESGRRMLALRWLATAPWDLAFPVLQEAADRDPDPALRKVAKDLILKHSPR